MQFKSFCQKHNIDIKGPMASKTGKRNFSLRATNPMVRKQNVKIHAAELILTANKDFSETLNAYTWPTDINISLNIDSSP